MFADVISKISPWFKLKPTLLDHKNRKNAAENSSNSTISEINTGLVGNGGRLEKKLNWQPVRMSGRLKFRKSNSIGNLTSEQALHKFVLNDDYPTCVSQFRKYAGVTTLHGYRYIMEDRRRIGERLFWICWCIFGISAAMYMMSKTWDRWVESPVITSVASTSYPVTELDFPGVTICTVNKAVNEKLIIQGCRYNKTLSEMKAIIGSLVDSEGRYNDYDANVLNRNPIGPEKALKLLRLVAPKCQDYVLSCRWNGRPAPCASLFKLVLTDAGYCCSFNIVEPKTSRKSTQTDAEVVKEEMEYDYLQKAVFDYTDRFYRTKYGPINENNGTTGTNQDTYTCAREYEDELFPGICKYIQKCRINPVACKLVAVTSTPEPSVKFSEEYPMKVAGSGRSRGLSLLLDTLRCDAVPTESFKGLRVYVNHPEEFPSVGEKGFLVAPGMESQVAVVATDTYSTEALRTFNPLRRGCYFKEEFPLEHYNEYSRSSCVVECENQFIFEECECIPYYLPGNHSICSYIRMRECVRKAIESVQRAKTSHKAAKSSSMTNKVERKIFRFKSKENTEEDKSCKEVCLPACNETFYDSTLTSANFPNQPEPNATKVLREAIEEKHTFLNDIGYVSASISVVRIFFKESSVLQYKRDELFTWEDFVSNLGGVMGLCLGFSLLSLIEVIYWFTLRFYIDRKNYRQSQEAVSNLITPVRF